MHGALCDIPTMDRSLLITILPYDSIVEGVTLTELYDEITWSLEACNVGCHPRLDSRSQPIAGWRAQIGGSELAEGWTLSFAWLEGVWKYTKD